MIFSDRWKDGRAQKGGKGIGHFAKYFQQVDLHNPPWELVKPLIWW